MELNILVKTMIIVNPLTIGILKRTEIYNGQLITIQNALFLWKKKRRSIKFIQGLFPGQTRVALKTQIGTNNLN